MAFVQLLFFSTWTIYVIYLPSLFDRVGLPRSLVPWLLIVDQLVFLVADITVGVAADRAGRVIGRIGPLIIGLTAVSCVAFLLLPHAGITGAAAPGVFLALTLAWTVTSSALRAPPWVMLGKHVSRANLPWLSTLMMFGLAAAGAIAPYLGVALKNLDPRWPFALSSMTLLVATAGIVYGERFVPRADEPARRSHGKVALLRTPNVLYLMGVLSLAAGFQIHFALNTGGQFLRFAKPDQLEWLLPLFWVGFAAGTLPVAALCKTFGAFKLMAVAALSGGVSAWFAAGATGLNPLIAAQFMTGAAWGCMLTTAFTIAADLGRTGREGLAFGLTFAALALATLLRIASTIAELNKREDWMPILSLAPVVLWTAGAVLIGALAWSQARGSSVSLVEDP